MSLGLPHSAVGSRNRQPQLEGSCPIASQGPQVAMLLGSKETVPDLSSSRASPPLSTFLGQGKALGSALRVVGPGTGTWGCFKCLRLPGQEVFRRTDAESFWMILYSRPGAGLESFQGDTRLSYSSGLPSLVTNKTLARLVLVSSDL